MRAIEILRNFPVEKWPHLKSGNRLPGKTACFSVKPSCRRIGTTKKTLGLSMRDSLPHAVTEGWTKPVWSPMQPGAAGRELKMGGAQARSGGAGPKTEMQADFSAPRGGDQIFELTLMRHNHIIGA
jgi:hypothetical protein